MFKITHKGYVISQVSNNHVVIHKDKKLVFHVKVKRKLTIDEMKEKVEFFIKIQDLLFDEDKN